MHASNCQSAERLQALREEIQYFQVCSALHTGTLHRGVLLACAHAAGSFSSPA